MDAIVLLSVLLLACALALLTARALLGVVFHAMVTGRLPLSLQWRPVVFGAALFWFWYLTPALASPQTVTRVLDLLSR